MSRKTERIACSSKHWDFHQTLAIPFSQEEEKASVIYTLKQSFDDKYEVTLNGHPCNDHVIHSGDYFAFKNKSNGKTVKTLFIATSDIQVGYKKIRIIKRYQYFYRAHPLNDISYDFSDFVSRENTQLFALTAMEMLLLRI